MTLSASLFTTWWTYEASGSGFPPGRAVELAIFDGSGKLVRSRRVGARGDGTITYSLGTRLSPGDYSVLAFKGGTDVLLATAAFNAPDDDSALVLKYADAGTGAAAPPSPGFLPPWQTCTGLGAQCPGLNPFGPFATP